MINYLSYKLGGFLAHHLPVRLSESITSFGARQYHRYGPSRRVVPANLRIVMGRDAGEEEIYAATKRVFANFAQSIYCLLRLPYITREEIDRRCDYDGIEKVTSRLRESGGFIIAGPHVGPWELGGACLSGLGNRIHTVALEHPSAKVTEFFDERRRTVGIQCYPIGKSFLPLRNALERGDCVALLVDRAYGKSKRPYRLFGRKINLSTGYATLAVRCGVPILITLCVFAPDNRFKFVFAGPHYPDPALDEEAAVERLHAQCLRDMERFIRAYVDQWFNFERLDGGQR